MLDRAGPGRHATVALALTAWLAAAAGAARPAAAQSWYLRWLARAEEWSLEKDYRGWILHGAIAAGVTLAADRIADRPAYGAAVATGFYLGKELREAAEWGGFPLDRVMDMATPVVGAVLTAYLLRRDRAPPLRRIVPPLPPGPCRPPPARTGADLVGSGPGPRRAPPLLPEPRPWLCLAGLEGVRESPGPRPGAAHAASTAPPILAARLARAHARPPAARRARWRRGPRRCCSRRRAPR